MPVVIVPQGPNWPVAIAGHLLEQGATSPEKAITLERTFWMKMGVLYPPKFTIYTNPVKVTPEGKYWVNQHILDNSLLYMLISIPIVILIIFLCAFMLIVTLSLSGIIT